MRRLALFGIGVAALVGPGATSAVAANVHPFLEAFGSTEQPSFSNAEGLAIDQGNGDLLVIEAGAGAISRYHEDGTPAPFSALGGNKIEGLTFGNYEEVQVAIDESGGPTDGDIYVTQGTAGVSIFAPTGAPLGSLTESSEGPLGEICGVAVDSSGAVYVGDFGLEVIHKFTPAGQPASNADNTANFPASGGPCTVAAGAGSTAGFFFAAGYRGALKKYDSSSGEPKYEVTESGTTTETVDPATGNVYVAEGDTVREYDASGAAEASLLSTLTVGTEVQGIAVNASTGNLYVARGTSQIEVYGPAVLLANAITISSSGVTNTTAKVSGVVNPEGVAASYQFEYGTTKSYGQRTPVPAASVGDDEGFHLEEAELIGLRPNTTYHFRIAAINANGTAVGADRTFTTFGPAEVETTGSPIRTTTTAQLEGRVNPERFATSFHFEYGTAGPCDANPCTATAPVEAGAGDEIELVSQAVGGLSPDTTYHYRVVADNGNEAGATFGEDMTVTTRASAAPLSHGAFPGPPGSDRSWEQVTPPDIGGNAALLLFSSAFGAGGDRAMYGIAGGSDGSRAGSTSVPYFSERTASGWTGGPIAPSREEAPGNVWMVPAGNEDLSNFVLVNKNKAGGGARSLWRYEAGAGRLTLVAGFEPGELEIPGFERGQLRFAEVSSGSASRVLAAARGSLDPSRPTAAGTSNLYDVSSGSPRLIDLLPGGSVPACGISEDFMFGMNLSAELAPMRDLGWLSPDGSLAYFSSSGDECDAPPQLYLRNLVTEQTRRVSPSPVSGPRCGDAFIKATPGAVFFWTQSRLADDDTAISGLCAPGGQTGGAAGGDVYRYDLGSGEVTCVTCVVPGAEADVFAQQFGWAQVGVAGDGSRVYFRSSNQLLPGAAAPGFYRVDVADGNLRYIAPAEANASIGGYPVEGSAMTPDGTVVVFGSADPGLNPVGGTDNGGTYQYYRYDDRDRSLTCASCPQDGSAPRAAARRPNAAPGLLETSALSGPGVTPLDDAGDFFFSTPTGLSPDDQNTAAPSQEASAGTDVYEWRDGRQLLVSDGTSFWPGVGPSFSGVTPSGHDVFFTSPQRLTPDAPDAFRRLYDARLGGGFAFPPGAPPPCPVGACDGTPRPAPASGTPGTEEFSGPGNPKPSTGRKHRRHHRKKRGRHHRKQHRHGNGRKHDHKTTGNGRQH